MRHDGLITDEHPLSASKRLECAGALEPMSPRCTSHSGWRNWSKEPADRNQVDAAICFEMSKKCGRHPSPKSPVRESRNVPPQIRVCAFLSRQEKVRSIDLPSALIQGCEPLATGHRGRRCSSRCRHSRRTMTMLPTATCAINSNFVRAGPNSTSAQPDAQLIHQQRQASQWQADTRLRRRAVNRLCNAQHRTSRRDLRQRDLRRLRQARVLWARHA